MKKLFEVLGTINGFQKNFRSHSVVATLSEKWNIVFGELSPSLRLSHIKDGVLFIDADNPVWVTEIRHFEAEFIEKMNQFLTGKSRLKGVRVRFLPKETTTISAETVGFNMDLEQKIIREIDRRREAGCQLCKVCGRVWDTLSPCSLCRAMQAS